MSELEAYIGSAKSSLGNRALNATWRPRIELALKGAESAHVRAEAAAAQRAAEPPVAVTAPAPAPKAKKSAKAAKVKAETAETAETAEAPETAEAGSHADEAEED